MKQYAVGLVGVGAVGTEMIKVLKERNFPMKGQVQVFASRERRNSGSTDSHIAAASFQS